ncbi:Diguanylate cyclase [Burkholderia multivorans]
MRRAASVPPAIRASAAVAACDARGRERDDPGRGVGRTSRPLWLAWAYRDFDWAHSDMSTPAILIVVLLSNCLLTSAVLGSLLRTDVPGVRRWLASQAMLAVALGAALAGGSSPPHALVAAAAVFYVGATLTVLQGFRQFFGVAAVRGPELCVVSLFVLALVYCTWIRPDHDLRAELISVFTAYVRLAIGWLAWRRRPPNRPAFTYVFVYVVAIGGAVVHLGRGAAYVLGQSHDTAASLSGTPMDVAFLILGTLSLLCLSMAVLMLVHDRMAERLERLATIDGLTGALMRGAFLDRAERLRLRAARTRTPLSFVIVDLDNFKTINDRHGHAAGDQALVRFSEVIQGGIRSCDLFGRLGGEEFALLCPDATARDAARAIDRLRASLAGGDEPVARCVVAFTFSAGVAECEPDERLSNLMARADAALYAAKAGGRDRVVVAEPADRAGSRLAVGA